MNSSIKMDIEKGEFKKNPILGNYNGKQERFNNGNKIKLLVVPPVQKSKRKEGLTKQKDQHKKPKLTQLQKQIRKMRNTSKQTSKSVTENKKTTQKPTHETDDPLPPLHVQLHLSSSSDEDDLQNKRLMKSLVKMDLDKGEVKKILVLEIITGKKKHSMMKIK